MSMDSDHLFPPPDAGRNEQAPAIPQADKPALPKRFYSSASSELREGNYVLLLDNRPAKTPGRAVLAVPHAEIADILVQEWQDQTEVINPAIMPMTRLVNSIIDGVSHNPSEVAAEIVRYAASDLLCYRAASPERLVRRQTQLWDPILAWFHLQWEADFILSEGVMFVEQPIRSLNRVSDIISAQSSPYAMGGLHVITTLTGSALLALALAFQKLTPDEVWLAAHVDEDVQAEIWGVDEEAMIRRAARLSEFQAASSLVLSAFEA